MSKVTLDSGLRTKLNGLNECLEFCDETGKTLGHFVPEDVFEKMFYAALAAESPHSAEELRARHKQSGGRPLTEIWKTLGQA